MRYAVSLLIQRKGHPAASPRLIAGLLYFQYAFNLPDEDVVFGWAENGSATSSHLTGFAVDFVCPRFGTLRQICQAIIASDTQFDQLILYNTFVHISFDPKKTHSTTINALKSYGLY